MAARIGTITGIALLPGVSKNGRLYTAEAIGRACARAQQRLAEEDGAPLTMLTHHEAGDDSRQIVGRLTALEQLPDGSARYSADLADTDEARRIAALVDTRDGPAFLRGVSIRGAWMGRVRTERGPDGQQVQTADDLEIDGLDFTRKPGVPGARVDTFTPADAAAPAETAPDGRVLITESVQEALVETTITEAAAGGDTSKPYGDVIYADPGYQKDKQKRYPLDTKARAKAAWSYVNQADNARLYTAAQLKRIKQRITKALKGFGVTVAAQEGWLIDPATQVTEALAECWGMDSADAGNLYVSLTNGPTTVTVSSYSLDPHDLDAVGRAAMAGACQTLLDLDPDMDGDVDVPGTPGDDEPASAAGATCPCGCGCAIPEQPGGCPCACESCMHCKTDEQAPDDNNMETTPSPASPTTAVAESGAPVDATLAAGITQTPAPETPAAENPTPEEEPAMAEPNTAAETAAAPAVGGVHLTDDQFSQLLNRLAPAAAVPAAQESAPAAVEPVAEAAKPAEDVKETEDERIARLVSEGIKAALPTAIQESVETNGPARKGLVQPVTETAATPATAGLPEGAPTKPLHEYTDAEWRQYIAPVTVGAVLGARGEAVQPE